MDAHSYSAQSDLWRMLINSPCLPLHLFNSSAIPILSWQYNDHCHRGIHGTRLSLFAKVINGIGIRLFVCLPLGVGVRIDKGPCFTDVDS